MTLTEFLAPIHRGVTNVVNAVGTFILLAAVCSWPTDFCAHAPGTDRLQAATARNRAHHRCALKSDPQRGVDPHRGPAAAGRTAGNERPAPRPSVAAAAGRKAHRAWCEKLA